MSTERKNGSEEINQKLPFNTQFVSSYEISPAELKWIAPNKINNRITLNQMGLNGLATTIVSPEKIKDINIEFIKEVVEFSNEVNEKIGLPKTDSLIIRTSTANGNKFSEPALLVADISSYKIKYELMGEKILYNSLNEFFLTLHPNTYLLMHDDNYDIQFKSLQGRIGKKSGGSHELFIVTDTLHPRDVIEKGENSPHIKIHAEYIEDLEHINSYQIAKYFRLDTPIQFPRMNVTIKYCDPRKADLMLAKLNRDFLMIKDMSERTVEVFGENISTEFRSYNIMEGGIGQKIHALDIN